MRLLLVAAIALGACQSQSSGGAAPASPAYAKDIDKLCNVLVYSGADKEPEGGRQLTVAKWLGPNLETTEVHTFLAKLQTLGPAAKADALDAEAKRVGLASCPLSAEWRKPPPADSP
ncbi:MAG TPA: hypothetical protein VL463_03595 [Kofleriaceae bacterium]|jgi:hypothetical protein|nr:hypothetical protein [Kofleriaceae bacterium]